MAPKAKPLTSADAKRLRCFLPMLMERALKVEDVELVFGTPELLPVVFRGFPKQKFVAKSLLEVLKAAAVLEDALEAVRTENTEPIPVAASAAPENQLQVALITPATLRKKQPRGPSPKTPAKTASPTKKKAKNVEDSDEDNDEFLPAVLADIKNEAAAMYKTTRRTLKFSCRLAWASIKFFGGFMLLALSITALTNPSILLRGTAALLKQFPHVLWGILNEVGLELWAHLLPPLPDTHCPDSCNFDLPPSWEAPPNRSSSRAPPLHQATQGRTWEHGVPPSAPVTPDWSAVSAVFATAALLLAAQKQ